MTMASEGHESSRLEQILVITPSDWYSTKQLDDFIMSTGQVSKRGKALPVGKRDVWLIYEMENDTIIAYFYRPRKIWPMIGMPILVEGIENYDSVLRVISNSLSNAWFPSIFTRIIPYKDGKSGNVLIGHEVIDDIQQRYNPTAAVPINSYSAMTAETQTHMAVRGTMI